MPTRLRARLRVYKYRSQHFAAAVIAALVCWHVLASFLWIAPPTPLRDLVPGTLLQQYMLPWFGQSWSVFAPAPINGDNEILVRATTGQGSTQTTTAWVNATDVEYALAKHNLTPPKAAAMGMHQAADFRAAWSALSTTQRQIVEENFNDSGELERQLAADSGRTPVASRYLTQDERARAYATNVAYTIWGPRVSGVQFLVQRRNIIPFAERNDPAAVRPAPTTCPTGWRKPSASFRASDPGFRHVFRQAWDIYKAQR